MDMSAAVAYLIAAFLVALVVASVVRLLRSSAACRFLGHDWTRGMELRGHPGFGDRPHPVHGGRAVEYWRCDRCREQTYENPLIDRGSVEDWT